MQKPPGSAARGVYPHLAGLFRGGVDAELIPEQWDQLARVAASLKNRVCPAHVIVQRLANRSPSDRLARALTMLGQWEGRCDKTQ
jgi:TnpA family transposase